MALTEELKDDFNDNSINGIKWANWSNGGGNTFSETGQQAVIILDGVTFGYSRYLTSTGYDLTGSYTFVQAITVPSNSTQAQAYIKLTLDASNYILIGKTGSNMYTQYDLATVITTTTTPYDAVKHLWWRIRESGGSILWDTSADGYTWDNLRTLASSFAVTSLKIEVGAGCFQAEASPGSFVFDNFNITAPIVAWFSA